MQDVQAGAVDGDIQGLGLLQVPGLKFRRRQREFVVGNLAAQADLNALKAQLLGQGQGLDVSGQAQVPVGDPDFEFRASGE